MSYFLAGLAVLVVALYLARGYIRANPATLARNIKIAAGAAVMAGAALLLVRGAASLAIPVAGFGWWLIAGTPGLPGSRPRSSGQTSRVTTQHLEVELDHDSGRLRGKVLAGFFAGRELESLRAADVTLLWQDCRAIDPQSAQLLEAYLDRAFPAWRDDLARGEAEMSSGPDGRMSESEALKILGLKQGADEAEIRRAHRELMLKMHPDRGGSTYLASKINEAKDVLLG